MQYMFLMMSEEAGWGEMPPAEQEEWLERYRGFDADMRRAGVVVSANHLAPSVSARTVQVREGRKVVTDGPFAETKEQLLGYFIVDVPGMDEAVEWAGKCPGAHHGAVEVKAIGIPPV